MPTPNRWEEMIEGCYLKSISQEHGIIYATDEMIDRTEIGDIVYIYPAHSCLSADLMKSYLTTEEVIFEGDSAFMP